MKESMEFNVALAKECAKSFQEISGIGCCVSLSDGTIVYEKGYGCDSCQICSLLGMSKEYCTRAHNYGLSEVERFGGKYIYYGPTGLTYFVSPIIGVEKACAKITVGPFLMIDKDDYIDGDLVGKFGLHKEAIKLIKKELEKVPFMPSTIVTPFSDIMLMCVGFLNNVTTANHIMNARKSNALQTQISHYIHSIKNAGKQQEYPFDIENKLLDSISKSDREGVGRYLNQLLGFIFLEMGADLDIAKSRVYELLVLISRKSISSGADPEKTLQQTHSFLNEIPSIETMDDLCFWITQVTNEFMDSLFTYMDVKHENLIHKTIQYVYLHYGEKITLENLSKEAYTSPSYLGRIFKHETGNTFSHFLSNVRIEKSKELLKKTDLKIIDISGAVGFDDQSYFTKVFTKKTGLSPSKYREKSKRS